MVFLSRVSGSFFSGERPGITATPELNCSVLSNITVTGKSIGGTVWGSNPYTDDSDWAVAAVHAGICAPGETVEIERYDPGNYAPYTGSLSNGVQTTNWAKFWCGYRIRLANSANPCGPYANVSVTGTSTGKVIGSNPYAIGTDIAAAAVHAGLCQPGDSIQVERYNPGLHAPYQGTFKNGIQSSTAIATNKCGFYIRKIEVTPPPTNKKVFDYISNAPQPYVVPPGVTLVKAKLWGAGGGGGKLSGYGGGGGYVYVEIPVTPGETLQVYAPRGGFPGGTGGFGTVYSEDAPTRYETGVTYNVVGAAPGWPYRLVTGGINSQQSIFGSIVWNGFNGGAGGGGYAAITRGGTYLAIAAGGGGAGDAGNGGSGGGLVGIPGQDSMLGPGGGGQPGTQSAGGLAGAGLYDALGIPGEPTEATAFNYFPAGYLIGGGSGAVRSGYPGVAGGGMGGGGFYGGGAGGTSAAGGGGGSSYIMPGLTGSTESGTGPNFSLGIPPSLPGNFGDPERGNKGSGAPSANLKQGDQYYGIKGQDGRVIIWYD